MSACYRWSLDNVLCFSHPSFFTWHFLCKISHLCRFKCSPFCIATLISFPGIYEPRRSCTCFNWVVKWLFGNGLKVTFFFGFFVCSLSSAWSTSWAAEPVPLGLSGFSQWDFLPSRSYTHHVRLLRGATADPVSSNFFLLCHLGWGFLSCCSCCLLFCLDWFIFELVPVSSDSCFAAIWLVTLCHHLELLVDE